MPTELPVLQASDVPPPLDPALITELSAEIRKRAVARHAQATAVRNYVDFYREILAVRTTGTER